MWRLPLYAHFNDKLEKNLAFSCAIAFRPAQCGNYTKPRCFRSRVGREGAYEQFLHMYLNDQTPNYFRGNKIGKLKTSASYSKRDVFNCRATQILTQPANFVQRACVRARLVFQCVGWPVLRVCEQTRGEFVCRQP